jgi:serine/threonine protein kinase
VIASYVGKGDNGEVYSVSDKTNMLKALKMIKLGIKGTEEFESKKTSILSELNETKKLGSENKNIVTEMGHFIEGEYLCLIMEYCSGGNIRDFIEKNKKISETVL